jgi:hypothetical protein
MIIQIKGKSNIKGGRTAIADAVTLRALMDVSTTGKRSMSEFSCPGGVVIMIVFNALNAESGN